MPPSLIVIVYPVNSTESGAVHLTVNEWVVRATTVTSMGGLGTREKQERMK